MAWIKYKYTCRYDKQLGVGHYDVPYIEVELSHQGKKLKVQALIDSGCTTTNINSDIATLLGIDLSNATRSGVTGISGSSAGYASKVKMHIPDQGNAFESPVIFMDNLPVAILLGQNNFFDTFKIKFEKMNTTFELSRV